MSETESPQPVKRRAPAAARTIAAAAVLIVGLLALATRRPAQELGANGPVAQPSSPPQSGVIQPAPTANAPAANSPLVPGKSVGNAPAAHVSNGPAEAPAPPADPTANPSDLPADHPEILQADEGTQVTLQWLGHACFYLHSPGGAAVVADPFDPKSTGLQPPSTGAHMVTVSSGDPQHAFTGAVRAFEGEKKEVVRGREARLKDLRVVPFPTGPNRYAYVYETAGLRIAHLGDLEWPLSAEQLKRLGPVDILLVPAGGQGVTPKQAVEMAQALAPKIVVPMAYSTSGMQGPDARLRPVDDFIAASPYAVTNKDLDTILIARSELPASTEIYTLKFRRE